jgi:hypothetical protein
MKIHPVRAQLFHADRRTGLTNLTAAFRDSACAPKNCLPNLAKTGEKIRKYYLP